MKRATRPATSVLVAVLVAVLVFVAGICISEFILGDLRSGGEGSPVVAHLLILVPAWALMSLIVFVWRLARIIWRGGSVDKELRRKNQS
jgi:hypothetical protein